MELSSGDEQDYGVFAADWIDGHVVGTKRNDWPAKLTPIILRAWAAQPNLQSADADVIARYLSDHWDELTAPARSTTVSTMAATEARAQGSLADRVRANDPQAIQQATRGLIKVRSDNVVPKPWAGTRLMTQQGEGIGEIFHLSASRQDSDAAAYPSVVRLADES